MQKKKKFRLDRSEYDVLKNGSDVGQPVAGTSRLLPVFII